MKAKIPNYISIARIALSVIALFVIKYPVLFIVVYMTAVISDVVDGYLARKWKVESLLGAQLDSIGDLAIYIVLLVVLFGFLKHESVAFSIGVAVAVIALRILNLVITRIKFGEFAGMHTWGHKITWLLLFPLVPYGMITGNPIPSWVLGVAGGFAILSCLEEAAILFKTDEYHVDTLSLFALRKNNSKNGY